MRTLLIAAGLLIASVELANVALSAQTPSIVTALITGKPRTTVCVQISPTSCAAMKSEGRPAGSCRADGKRDGCIEGFVAVDAGGQTPK